MEANASTIGKGEKIQKKHTHTNTPPTQFSAQQPADTYRHRCQVQCTNPKVPSTGVIPEEVTFSTVAFSFKHIPNQITRFHPSFLQGLLCKPNPEAPQKRKALVSRWQWSDCHKRELSTLAQSCDNHAFLAQRLHCLVTCFLLASKN